MTNKFNRHGHIVPVLRAIGSKMPISRVIEFGCGLFSTLTLLNKKYFPDIVTVYSYEIK